ncbi:MAG: mechanosensitive ion channel [Planctomycetes bacterium]|nr:mechanosensitive ion channel [Planctomycetota bacterium]
MDIPKLLEDIYELLAIYGLKVIGAIAILILGRWAAKIAAKLIRRALKKANTDETLTSFVYNISYAVMLAFVIIAALNQLGIQTASLIAILGAGVLAIGLALQGSLSNFAAGVLMVVFKPFKIDDYIEGGGASGTVEDIQIFTTVLKTADNKTIVVPNSTMMSNNIVNYSTKGVRRVDMVFGIGYEDDIDRARELILEIVTGDERVFKDPAPVVMVSELADSSVNLSTRVWSNAGDYWGIYFDATEKVKKTFDAEGISIPFPQRDIHIYQAE